jgi:hypothetical protein
VNNERELMRISFKEREKSKEGKINNPTHVKLTIFVEG